MYIPIIAQHHLQSLIFTYNNYSALPYLQVWQLPTCSTNFMCMYLEVIGFLKNLIRTMFVLHILRIPLQTGNFHAAYHYISMGLWVVCNMNVLLLLHIFVPASSEDMHFSTRGHVLNVSLKWQVLSRLYELRIVDLAKHSELSRISCFRSVEV